MRPISRLLISLALLGIVASSLSSPASAVPYSAGEGSAGLGAMTPEEREDAVAYSTTKYLLYFVGVAYTLIVLAAILLTAFSARLRNWAERIGRRWVLIVAVYALLFFLTVSILELPLSFFSGYVIEHQYELSNQTVGAWLWDEAKNVFLVWIIGTLVLLFAYWLIRKSPRAWWAWLALGSIPFLAFFMIIVPIVVMPMFYTITPMEESPLKTRVLNLAAEGGIEDPEIYVMDASRQTNKLNAMVTGLGQTKRILFYDTTLDKMTDGEILFVVGHEMAHYLQHHMWIAVLIASGLIFLFGFLTNALARPIIRRFSDRFGFSRLSDIASFPLLLAFVTVFSFLFDPITNGIWRNFEHRADIYGMDLTGDGEAAANAFEKLAAANLSNPNPPPFIEFWLYDHPTLADRVEFVRSYQPETSAADPLRLPGERHLRNIRQLTFGGQNAEAYFSTGGSKLIFQSTRDTFACDQIYTMTTRGDSVRLVSTGEGVTTCSFFAPGGDRIIYCSTHLGGEECPPKPSYEQGYVWAVYPDYDVFSARPDGSDLTRLTSTPGYDAESVYSPDGNQILFTSVRDGDLELYVMAADGNNPQRLTHQIGYDGGAFFSPDGSRIVYRAHHPQDAEEIAEYQELLAQNLVRPSIMEIFVMDADGSNRRQVTRNGAANFCPYFHPNGHQIIFASNMDDPTGQNFDLYLINDDGTGLERITFNETFDAFPMFSRDGSKLVFASNRNNTAPRETNVFIADWID